MFVFSKRFSILFIPAIFSAFSSLAQTKEITVNINLSATHQTIDNFGASDAWSCQFVGNWPDAKKNKIADLLFSKETYKDGSPKGIALSLWRFNIGAGTTEQGKASGIDDEWHRTECFADNAGNYDWNKQQGQLWFLKAAKARGVDQFLGFTNSPPVQFTLNGKGFTNKDQGNIGATKYGAYATYLADVVTGLRKSHGIKLEYISPFNEPQWSWSDGKQEGCPYTNEQMAAITRRIDSAFKASAITSKIVIGEAGSIDYLYTHNKEGKGKQINAFFNKSSNDYIGGLTNVLHTISSHSYFTTSPFERSVTIRKTLKDSLEKINGLKFWQSEYCILGDNDGEINGSGRDTGMNAALYMARVIHTDMAVANASAWQWWLAVSPYDYKDGLIYVDKNNTDGNFYTSKMLWVLGNYSRFIRPGALRVDAVASAVTAAKPSVFISAYKKDGEFTMVIINNNKEDIAAKLNRGAQKITLSNSYVTSAANSLKAYKLKPNQQVVTIPAQSVTTITGIIKN